jgi:predicted nucleotidyltransferase
MYMPRELPATPAIPERFLAAYQHIERLGQYDRYLAALIFGSLARGMTTEKSDLDVIVLVDEDNSGSSAKMVGQ